MQLDGVRVLVVGAGKSGLAAAAFCAEQGANVTLTDSRHRDELGAAVDELPAQVTRAFGGHAEALFTHAELIVCSPGVPEIAPLAAARARGIPVTGEIELASQYITAPIVAVTGTNGKSTVTSLAGEMARQTGRPTFVGGNLGTPLLSCVGTPAASVGGIVVVELSSFQLETCETLHPRAAVLLNLTPDHLDRYVDVAAYAAAKLRIAVRLTQDDLLVVSADDPILAPAIGERYPQLRPLRFTTRGASGCEGFVDRGSLTVRIGGVEERYPVGELQLVGRHNQGNALAALLLMRGSGLCSSAEVRRAVAKFQPLPHRMERIAVRGGVSYFDDSKATNVDAVVAGVDGFPTPFVLIAGGREKGGSYEPLVATLARTDCRGVVLIGEATEPMARALEGALPWSRARSLPDAVATASTMVHAGHAVVLSPACASYDMFDNYEHRARVFREAVEALPK